MWSVNRTAPRVNAEWIECVTRASDKRVIDDVRLRVLLEETFPDVSAIERRLQSLSRAILNPTLPAYRPALTEDAKRLHELKKVAAEKLLDVRTELLERYEHEQNEARVRDERILESMRAKLAV